MASDDWADGDESGPSYAPSGPLPGTFLGPALDIRSDSLYELTPELQDVMGLRAVRPDAAVAKVMSVRNSRCIRVVTPDDHVICGYHEILLHDLGDEDLPFVSISELDYLRRIWPRAVFAFMTRYQHDLELKWKECKERFGCTQSGKCTHCGKIYSDGFRQAHCFLPLRTCSVMALPSYVVYSVEGNCSGLH